MNIPKSRAIVPKLGIDPKYPPDEEPWDGDDDEDYECS